MKKQPRPGKFLEQINANVNTELNKIGLEIINVNIKDITDESGYIDAIGKKAAAEAINKAKVEVAQQEKLGAVGEAEANKEKEVQVAEQTAQTLIGKTNAEKEQRVQTANIIHLLLSAKLKQIRLKKSKLPSKWRRPKSVKPAL